MFRLGLPEIADWREFGYDLARPQARGIDVGNRIERRLFLNVIHVVNRRTIRRATVIALPAGGGWIMYLKKELQDTAIGNLIRTKEYSIPSA